MARNQLKKAQKCQKRNYDWKSEDISLRVGDCVFLFITSMKQGKAHKFARPFRGPYRVVILYENGAHIRPLDRPEQSTTRVSLNRLRKCPDEICVPGNGTLTQEEDSQMPLEVTSRDTDQDGQEAGILDISQETPFELCTPETMPVTAVSDATVDVPTMECTRSESDSQHSKVMPRRGV